MLEKFNKDGLLFHKLGVIIGAIIGILLGLFVSAQADEYEEMEVAENETTEL